MNSECGRIAIGLALVLAAGALLGRAERTPPPARTLPPAGQFFAALGGAGDWVADWGWLNVSRAWERRDEATLRAWLVTVRAAAPEREHFRFNAARMLAFDLPAWRAEAEPAAPEGVRARWRQAGAEEALAWLELETHGDAGSWIEAGNIALYALRDRERAIACYGRAAAAPAAPWHAGRIQARLLVEAGRVREAVGFLRGWVPRLPAEDPAAQRALMLERLAELERTLEAEGF